MMRLLRVLAIVVAALVALRLYVGQREAAAVANARLKHVQDSVATHDAALRDTVRAVLHTDSVMRAARDTSVARQQQSEAQLRRAAAQASGTAQAASEALHALTDTNAVLRAAVAQSDSANAAQVALWMRAAAHADTAAATQDSIIRDQANTIKRLSASVADFESSNATLQASLDEARHRTQPGLGKRIIGAAPWVAAAFVLGAAVGGHR